MAELKKVKASMMNAVHDLPLLVARDEGFFRDEGLDVDILVTPGSGQHNSDDRALKDDIFKRGLEATYDQGQCDQFRMCEWGIMKRAVETIQEKNLRPAKIVALGSAMSSFAIVVDPRSGIYEPEQLKNVPIAVSQYNGSHFTMLKMMEGFIKRDEIKIANHGTHRQRMEAVMSGKVKAASLQEPWISVAEAKGGRVIIESHSTRSEAAGDEMDGPTLAKMFRAEARAAEAIQKNPEKYRALHRGRGRRHDRPEGPQAGAHPQRAAGALHARALRRQLQLDARLGPRAARRDLREHGRQPRLAVTRRIRCRGAGVHVGAVCVFAKAGTSLLTHIGETESPKPPLDQLYRRPGFMIRRAHQIAVSMFLEETGALGITNRQYGIMLVLRHQPGIDQITVAKLLGLDRSTTGMVLGKLEDAGLVGRVVGASDRRKRSLKLTPAGERMLARLAEPARRAQERVLSAFSPHGTEDVSRSAGKVRTRVQRHHARAAGGAEASPSFRGAAKRRARNP